MVIDDVGGNGVAWRGGYDMVCVCVCVCRRLGGWKREKKKGFFGCCCFIMKRSGTRRNETERNGEG